MPPRPELTDRQREVLGVIRQSIASRGRPPTFREMQGPLKIKSPNGVTCHLKALAKKGYIERESGKHVGIKLVEDAETVHPHALAIFAREARRSRMTLAAVSLMAAQLLLVETSPRGR